MAEENEVLRKLRVARAHLARALTGPRDGSEPVLRRALDKLDDVIAGADSRRLLSNAALAVAVKTGRPTETIEELLRRELGAGWDAPKSGKLPGPLDTEELLRAVNRVVARILGGRA